MRNSVHSAIRERNKDLKPLILLLRTIFMFGSFVTRISSKSPNIIEFSLLFKTDKVCEKFEFKMKDGLNFCGAYTNSESHTLASTDLFVCAREPRVHSVFSQREVTRVTWLRVPELLSSAILVVCVAFSL